MKRLIRKARLPILKDSFKPYEYDYIDIGLQTVNVADIIGMTDSRVDEYNNDWTPKNENDERWLYQKMLVENGQTMEPVPLVKTPDGKYFPAGDGNHRVSVAKVLGLQTIDAYVSVMIPVSENIDEQWQEYAVDRYEELNILNDRYKEMSKQVASKREEAMELKNMDIYTDFINELYALGDEISELDRQLLEDEKNFKQQLIQEYM